jgi:uncharacterized protein (TIGR00369 family)
MRRLENVMLHLKPVHSSRVAFGDGVAVLDEELCEAEAVERYLKSRVRIATERARIKVDGVLVGLSDGVWLRLFTHHVKSANLVRLTDQNTDQDLMRLSSPVEQRRELVSSVAPRPKQEGAWQQIFNPWQEFPGFACFGCDPSPVASSLRLVFFDGPGDVVGTEHFCVSEGYPGVVHGGVLATIADELSYFAFVKHNKTTAAMTKSLFVEYLKPVASKQFVSARASCVGNVVRVEISNAKNVVCCVASVTYVVPKQQMQTSPNIRFNL